MIKLINRLKKSKKLRIRHKLLSEKGTSAVELAIVAPLLIAVTFAAFGLAEAGQKKALVARAAMQGARMSVVKDIDEVRSYVKHIMKTADPSIDVTKIDVKIENEFDEIPILKSIIIPQKVIVTYDHPIFSGFLGLAPTIRLEKSYIYEKWDNAVFFDVL